MIEVEIRGRLTDEAFEKLTALLKKEGELLESQDREMILLRGYPGYDKDPTTREVDIRLRNTNGACEVMLKKKTADHNVARHEISLPLKGATLDAAKEVMKALGYAEGIWMHRKKDVYRYKGVEWSVVDVPGGLRYYEAEKEAATPEDASRVHDELVAAAAELGLAALGPEEMREFIYTLDKTVNREIAW